MTYRMCNYDYDVVYQGLSQSIRHTSKCSYAYSENKEAIAELIQMAETVIKNLSQIEFIDMEDE